MRQMFLFKILALSLSVGATAADFVPFVIPARPNENSQIAFSQGDSIDPSDERMVGDSGHFCRGDKRVRLWGVNLSFGANLPRHEDAPYVAARLAAAGVNAVRCHHMDTARWPRGLWNAEDGKTIASQALDRLDSFIDQLARHGICVNINLHVGREHSRYLGLPRTSRNYDKVCTIFTPALIDAQKQYARELLTHVNPYRKVRYADDPAVAIVEITNENSFFMWDGEETLRTLPGYYAEILQEKFNEWLEGRYGSDQKLRKAWSEGAERLGKSLLANGNFNASVPRKDVPQAWDIEQHSGCKALVSRHRYQSKQGLCIEVGEADDTEWHLQLNQRGFAVEAGRYYTVLFEAASDNARQIGCGVGQAHSPWHNLGLSRRVELNENWQSFKFGFVAKADEANARISFSFGANKIPFYLANVELRPGGRVGLQEGESLRSSNVAVFADNETLVRTLDRMRFLAETEKAYFDDMRSFIKKELGSGALVTGTIVFGPLGLYAQSDMDFIDTHAYWQHPRFPGRAWDSGNWLVSQKPMTDYPGEATLFRLAAERLGGKPFTLSEYNHPAPLDSQAECVPMIASFAAVQDWDGVWLYTYSHSSDSWDRETLNGYFDIDTNPAKWGFMWAGTAIFRQGGISPLDVTKPVTLTDSVNLVAGLAELHLKHDRDMFTIVTKRGSITREKVLDAQLAVALCNEGPAKASSESHSRLVWSVEDGQGLYAARGRCAWVYTGHAERFEAVSDGEIAISAPAFVALTVTALDEVPLNQSRRILVTVCGRCENAGMKFSADRQTVGRNWGGPPVQIEAVEGTLMLPEGRWMCNALAPDGVLKCEVPVKYRWDRGVLQLSPRYETMWYLLSQRDR